MKALGWYSAVMIAWTMIYMLVDAVTTQYASVVADNIWGIVLYAPIMVFLVLFLVKIHKERG